MRNEQTAAPDSTEMISLARDAGFKDIRHVSAATLAERYFSGRTDGLRPPKTAEELLVATTRVHSGHTHCPSYRPTR